MNSYLYDISIPYDENWEKGPPLLSQKLVSPTRIIQKNQKFLNFEVNVPFGIPAGPLLNSRYVKVAFEWGFDVVAYKTQRSCVFPTNAFPNILFVDVDGDLTLKRAQKPLIGRPATGKKTEELSITNSFGNPSPGPDVWQEDMKRALWYEGPGQLLVASVVGTVREGSSQEDYFDDFADTAKLAKETGVKIIEVNLSCPNVDKEGIICYTAPAVEQICRKTKETIGNLPLLAKLGYFSKGQQALLETIVKKLLPFVAGISVINTIPAPVVNEDGGQALPGQNRLISGICGASIQWAGIDMVKRLAQLRDRLHANYAIVGVGGVMRPDDYFEYRKAGADLVQSATGAMWNPYLAWEIWAKEQEQDLLLAQVSAAQIR